MSSSVNESTRGNGHRSCFKLDTTRWSAREGWGGPQSHDGHRQRPTSRNLHRSPSPRCRDLVQPGASLRASARASKRREPGGTSKAGWPRRAFPTWFRRNIREDGLTEVATGGSTQGPAWADRGRFRGQPRRPETTAPGILPERRGVWRRTRLALACVGETRHEPLQRCTGGCPSNEIPEVHGYAHLDSG